MLGSLVGFASSLLPDIFSILRDRKDKEHELAILDKQMEFMEKRHHNRIEETRATADANESQIIYKFAAKSGNSLIDAFSTSVRPILSYAFLSSTPTLKSQPSFFCIGITMMSSYPSFKYGLKRIKLFSVPLFRFGLGIALLDANRKKCHALLKQRKHSEASFIPPNPGAY